MPRDLHFSSFLLSYFLSLFSRLPPTTLQSSFRCHLAYSLILRHQNVCDQFHREKQFSLNSFEEWFRFLSAVRSIKTPRLHISCYFSILFYDSTIIFKPPILIMSVLKIIDEYLAVFVDLWSLIERPKICRNTWTGMPQMRWNCSMPSWQFTTWRSTLLPLLKSSVSHG